MVMPAWFDLLTYEKLSGPEDEDGVCQSAAAGKLSQRNDG